MTLWEGIQRNKYLCLLPDSDFLLDVPIGGPKQKPESQNAVDVIHRGQPSQAEKRVNKDEECYRGANGM